jgi:hypothetical protein
MTKSRNNPHESRRIDAKRAPSGVKSKSATLARKQQRAAKRAQQGR